MAIIHSCVTPRGKWQGMGFVVCFFSLFMFSVSGFRSVNSTHSSNTDEDIRSDVLYRNGAGPSPKLFPKDTLNDWKRVDKWTGNTPGKRRGHAASHLRTTGTDGKMVQNMVLFGGYTEGNPLEIGWAGSITWIYTPGTNSWRLLLSQIPRVVGHTMVTMCNKVILLFGGAEYHEDYDTLYKMSNDTRSFSGESEKWTNVEVEKTDDGIKPRIHHGAVSVHQTASHHSCTCKESMLVFGGNGDITVQYLLESDEDMSYDIFWELRCVENGYRWFHLNSVSGESGKPSMRYFPATASHFDVMFMYGGCKPTWRGLCETLYDLWTFSTKSGKWERLRNEKRPTVGGSLKLVYVEKPSYRSSGRVSGFLLCCRKPLYFYDILTQQWDSLDTLDSDEDFEDLVDVSTAVVDGNIIVYGGVEFPQLILQDGLWNITMLARDACLLHKKHQDPLSPPVRGMQVAVIDRVANMMIVHGGLTPETFFDSRGVYIERNTGIWLLDMHSLTWSVRHPSIQLSRVSHVGALLSYPDTVLVIFGGFRATEKGVSPVDSTWGYFPQTNTWIEYKFQSVDYHPITRYAASATAISDRSMVMMGGLTVGGAILNDTWVFTTTKYSRRGKWTRLITEQSPQRFGHTSVLVGKKILLYGGMGPNANETFHPGQCSDELWEFNLNFNQWQRLYYKGSGPGQRCHHSSTGNGEKMVVSGGCHYEKGYIFQKTMYSNDTLFRDIPNPYVHLPHLEGCRSSDTRPSVWYYSLTIRQWNKLAPLPFKNSIFIEGQLLVWGERHVIAFGGYSFPSNATAATKDEWYSTVISTGFWVTTMGCPAGTKGLEFWNSNCVNCSQGQFSEFNSPNCFACPQGFSTPNIGAKSKMNCTLCDPSEDYCNSGVCYVPEDLIARYMFERRCRCHGGFTRDHMGKCTIPMAYIAGTAALLAVAISVCVTFVLVRAVRAKRAESKKQEWQESQLRALNSVWNINPREIALGERIDSDTPGGFGEVYIAEYREMTVAVKKLQNLHIGINRYAQEIDREIQLMRTLRHPNIVLFYGGGHFEEDDSPFLVVEYMPRGSLGAILRDEKVQLGNSQKLAFALDAAEGMAFLHSLKPPRIHRDLKSFNLLVSDRWTVKVADFGAARLVKQEGITQAAIRDCSAETLTTPLLEADAMLSTDCGSLLWSAPEILQRRDYGTSVDIYSFGVVLWEIWERKLPYHDYDSQFSYQIHALVCQGTRPTIPENNDWPDNVVNLMRSCWRHEPHKRPSFKRVLTSLNVGRISVKA